MHQKSKNSEVYQKLCEVIPGGVNSPVRSCKAVGQAPLVASWAKGDLVYDVDGNEFIDFCCSWGALLHGHAHPQIVQAATERVSLGSSFGMTTEIEEKLARKIIDHMPSIQKIRFVSSGTEATMSAARLARGYTKRNLIVKFAGHYHGHADFFLVQAGSGVSGFIPSASSAGIPEEIVQSTICLPFNDCEALKRLFQEKGSQIAAVILEPIAANMGLVWATHDFMQLLRNETQRHGSLLIFDEVITGFRVGLKGASEIYQIKPDLITLGKIVGGGFPAAAFGGSAEIMEMLAPLGPVYQAGTLSGNPVAMVAGLISIQMAEEKGFYEMLAKKTEVITKPVKEAIQQKGMEACIQEVGSLFTLFFGKSCIENFEDTKKLDFQLFGKFFRYMFKHGVYIPPLQQEAWFVSAAHTQENLEKTRDLILQFLQNEV